MKRIGLWFWLTAFIYIVSQPDVLSAAMEKDSPDEVPQMEEVVVTATKIPEPRKDIPNAIIIVDKIDIEASGAKSIGEILANEPGIDWRSGGDFGGAGQEIHIRGIRGNGTQVLVNGVNINSPSLGLADVGKIPMSNIDRIEVIKGSGSLLYGSGAMGGVVNIITKRPERDETDLKIGGGYGTQDTYRLWVEQGTFVANDFGYYLTANRTETDGFRFNSDLRQNDFSMKLVLEKSDALDISLYGDYIDRNYGIPGVEPPAGTSDYYVGGRKFYNHESASLLDHGGDRDGHLILEVQGKPNPWFGYKIKGYYNAMENLDYRYGFDGSKYDTQVTNEIMGTDGHITLQPFDTLTILLGAEYRDFDWERESLTQDGTGHRIDEMATRAHLFTRGVFSEIQYRPSAYLKLFAGIRHEKHSTFGYEDLPFFGLIVNPFSSTTIKINHGKHFSAPTPNDLFWPEDPYTKGNPDLKPEIGWHTDITLEQSLLHDRVFASISYFQWNVDDKIQWQLDPTWVYTPTNLPGYEADGVEAGIKIGPFYDLTLGLSYTWLDAEEEIYDDDRRLKRRAIYSPEAQFKGDLMYQNRFGLSAKTTVRYTSNRKFYRDHESYILDSYWTVDLKLEQRFYSHYLASVSVNNLTDTDYDTYKGMFYDHNWQASLCNYPGAGRSVFAGLSYEF